MLPAHDRRLVPVDQSLKNTQISLGAILAGLMAFAIVGTWTATRGATAPAGPGLAAPGSPSSVDPLVLAMGALAAVGIVAFVVVGGVAKNHARGAFEAGADPETGRAAVARVLQTSSIVRAAIAEGAGLVGALVIFSRGDLFGWIGVGVAFVLIASLLPVRARFDALVQHATGRALGSE